MRTQIYCSGRLIVGMAFLSGLAACASSPGQAGAKGSSTVSLSDAGCVIGDPNATYVLIDDMETTTHGPIELAGISSPLSPGYWYNSGASYLSDAGANTSNDSSNPPQLSFVFSALPTPTTTLNCNASAHAARQSCVLNGLYDTCGVGLEFAQVPDGDAGAPSSTSAGDAGPPIPMVTVPFDISRYKAITFWGMTTTPDPTTNSMQVKVQFPDTDTDPRGEICNGGGGNTSKCYNSYASYLNFTTSWQKFTVLLDAGKGGVPPNRRHRHRHDVGLPTGAVAPHPGLRHQLAGPEEHRPERRSAPQDRHLGRRRVLRRVSQGAGAPGVCVGLDGDCFRLSRGTTRIESPAVSRKREAAAVIIRIARFRQWVHPAAQGRPGSGFRNHTEAQHLRAVLRLHVKALDGTKHLGKQGRLTGRTSAISA